MAVYVRPRKYQSLLAVVFDCIVNIELVFEAVSYLHVGLDQEVVMSQTKYLNLKLL